jgi:hypothetical protein
MRHSPLSVALLLTALAIASPAQADFTSHIGGGGAITFTGDADSDIVSIRTEGGALRHDRFGDPGFASNLDWETSVAGVQTVGAGALINVNVDAGSGSDFVVIGGNGGASAASLSQDYYVDGGAGNDALKVNSEDDTLARTAAFSSNLGTGTIDFTGNSATGDVRHSEFEGVLVTLGSAPDTTTVATTESDAFVGVEAGNGNDTATVGTAAGLTGIAGRFSFDGEGGTNDSLLLNDATAGSGGTYLVTPQGAGRAGLGDVVTDATTEAVTLTTSAQADSIFKSGPRPVTINAGAGDDLISARDSIGDTANCGAGNDFVLSDSLDALSDCEASDRTLAAQGGGGGGGGGGVPTLPGGDPPVTPPPADTTPPVATIGGLKGTIKRKALLKGLKAKVAADERASYEVQLLGSTRSVRLARTFDLTLARQALPLSVGMQDIKLKPSKRTVGKARRFTVRVVVTPTDAVGNRGKPVVRTLKVR